MENNIYRNFRESAANITFNADYIKALSSYTEKINNLRILDYGAGAVPTQNGFFNRLQNDQASVRAYDPYLKDEDIQTIKRENGMVWTNKKPVEQFDLVVCHFSLHHIEQTDSSFIDDFKSFNPSYIGIADYDYSKVSSPNVFIESFISQKEEKELTELFNGDVMKCFKYHQRLGVQDYRRIMKELGFKILKESHGVGVAAYKFYIIGARK